MRIFIIDTYYPSFLKSFYTKKPYLKNASYGKQKKTLLDEQFGTADFYSKNLEKLGYKAEEFIANNEILQKRWAKEHNLAYQKGFFQSIPKVRNYFKPIWVEKILEAQIKEFEPDIIYSQNLYFLKPKFLYKIKKNSKLLVGQIASPIPDKNYLQLYDLILTSFSHYVNKFKSIGIKGEYLKFGFEHTIISRLSKQANQYCAVFIGGFTNRHKKGTELLEHLARKVKIDFWGYGIDNLNPNSPILKNYHGEAWGLEMYNILFNSEICINRHIDVAENYANNMRLYEATGCGTTLITDYKKNLGELFKIGQEIEAYSSKKELVEKINYYLNHNKERKKIAKAGQKRTLKEHAYRQRMKELVKILEKYL